MAITYMASLRSAQAAEHAADTGSGRLAFLAARFATRLGGAGAEAAVGDDPAWLEDFDGIVRGGPVKPETGASASAAAAAYLSGSLPEAITS